MQAILLTVQAPSIVTTNTYDRGDLRNLQSLSFDIRLTLTFKLIRSRVGRRGRVCIVFGLNRGRISAWELLYRTQGSWPFDASFISLVPAGHASGTANTCSTDTLLFTPYKVQRFLTIHCLDTSFHRPQIAPIAISILGRRQSLTRSSNIRSSLVILPQVHLISDSVVTIARCGCLRCVLISSLFLINYSVTTHPVVQHSVRRVHSQLELP